MFIRSLDEKELEAEEFENMTGEKMDKIFPRPRWGNPCCWSKFKNSDPRDIYNIISRQIPHRQKYETGTSAGFYKVGRNHWIIDDSVSCQQGQHRILPAHGQRHVFDSHAAGTPKTSIQMLSGMPMMFCCLKKSAKNCGSWFAFGMNPMVSKNVLLPGSLIRLSTGRRPFRWMSLMTLRLIGPR